MIMRELILAIVFLGIYFFFKKINHEVRMDEARRQYEEMLKEHNEWGDKHHNESWILGTPDDVL